MSLTKRNFEEEFERELLETNRYLIAQKKAEESYWFEQIIKENINTKSNLNKNGKFIKKTKKGIYKIVSKRYEKCRSSKSNE